MYLIKKIKNIVINHTSPLKEIYSNMTLQILKYFLIIFFIIIQFLLRKFYTIFFKNY